MCRPVRSGELAGEHHLFRRAIHVSWEQCKMSPEKYYVEVISPTPDAVHLVGQKVHVKVRATGRTKVVAVRAQAFRNHAPANPEYPLAIANTPHVYEGDIPTYPIGTFGIKVLAEFEGQPTVKVPVEAGPFEVPLEA